MRLSSQALLVVVAFAVSGHAAATQGKGECSNLGGMFPILLSYLARTPSNPSEKRLAGFSMTHAVSHWAAVRTRYVIIVARTGTGNGARPITQFARSVYVEHALKEAGNALLRAHAVMDATSSPGYALAETTITASLQSAEIPWR
ncbi:uncharacterized protein RSE6_12954 [Rhynchosporium secalis]|uniref:Uncharacterized protein n=1 Tax=Rhynchosporium secalis TaxID=38038 RepID=A0A1E1MRP1_RHYSE|nr:uncharacterized protein RSE6_12954 [Rhynchosporium secalis]